MTTDQKPIPEELISTFAEIAEMTKVKCGQCANPYGCCSKEQCEMTKQVAQDVYGIELEPGSGELPFLGPEGCTLAPHLRPLCSIHVCDRHILSNEKFAEEYFELRERAGDLLTEYQFPE